MISYHPDSRFLTDFVSGDLPVSQAICVSAHLEFCGKCRARVHQIEALGGILLSQLPSQAPDADSFDQLMSRIESEGESSAETSAVAPSAARSASVPSALADVAWPRALGDWTARYLEDLQWVQFGKDLRVAPLPIDEDWRDFSIYDIRAGGKMPSHAHGGEEISVLLKGSYSDAEGKYTRGDFIVRNAGENHQPTATQDSDCICLVSLERPVTPDRWFYRFANPLVQYRLNSARQRVRSRVEGL